MTCLFCEMLETGDVEWLVNDRDAVAFFPLPAGRLAPGHTLIVPTHHCVGVLDAPPGVLAATTALLPRVGQAMTRALDATGLVVLNASGPSSGQSVAHLHFHLLPRWPDDRADLWPADRSQHTVDGDARALLAAEVTR